MPFERSRSVAQTHAFLTEHARDTELPERIRQNAH
ncbi:BPSL0761 family protein [Pseudomonas sp. CCI1.1]|nr:BPSL0761 family protein [Pseudomonas sp. CCI1.1]MEB0191509.1 BPSL0761 family protein [Pseudomonas sp. CCI1.1]